MRTVALGADLLEPALLDEVACQRVAMSALSDSRKVSE